jgi:hypothetical protein
LIVSDRAGYDLVADLTSGIAFNFSISSIIILAEDKEIDQELIKIELKATMIKKMSTKFDGKIKIVKNMEELVNETNGDADQAISGFEKFKTNFKADLEKSMKSLKQDKKFNLKPGH